VELTWSGFFSAHTARIPNISDGDKLMVDTVTTQLLENGGRFAVMKFTNVSDGTGEAGVVKVDATSTGLLGNHFQGNLIYPGTHLAITAIKYSTSGMSLRIQWQGTPNTDAIIVAATDHWAFKNERDGFGGLVAPSSITPTGSILFTTIGAATNSSYTVILTLTKNIPGNP
jgi:hypothetical protein